MNQSVLMLFLLRLTFDTYVLDLLKSKFLWDRFFKTDQTNSDHVINQSHEQCVILPAESARIPNKEWKPGWVAGQGHALICSNLILSVFGGVSTTLVGGASSLPTGAAPTAAAAWSCSTCGGFTFISSFQGEPAVPAPALQDHLLLRTKETPP